MSEELKPCPFCGGIGLIMDAPLSETEMRYTVQCMDCDIETNRYFMANAIAAWNRRQT